MKRLRLILLNLLAVVSIAVLTAALVFWSSAYERTNQNGYWCAFHIKHGELSFLYSADDWPPGEFLMPIALDYSATLADLLDEPRYTHLDDITPYWERGAGMGHMIVYDSHSESDVMGAFVSDMSDRWFFANFHDDPWQIVLHVNLLALAIVTGILPLAFLIRTLFRHRRMARDNVCRKCSYDLTGNVTGVCPECGSPIVAGRV